MVNKSICDNINRHKICFTLAEAMIALAIVGVVAAITIPTLSAIIFDHVKESQIAVFEKKLTKHLTDCT